MVGIIILIIIFILIWTKPVIYNNPDCYVIYYWDFFKNQREIIIKK